MTDLARPLTRFLRRYLPHERGASRHTVESYAGCFRRLAVFAAERHRVRPCELSIEQLDADTVADFLDHLETEFGNSVQTRNLRLAAVKSFFRYLEFRNVECLEAAARIRSVPWKRADRPTVSWIDRAEVQALLDAPDTGTVAGVRDRAMLHLAYNAGLRVSELTGLPLANLGTPRLDEVRIMGKGRRERVLPLWKQTCSALRDWLAVRPDVADPHLFLNSSGTGMTRRGFAKRLAGHCRTAARTTPSLAGRTVTPHAFRHACALNILEATGDVRQVALWLGHASLRSTEMYLRVDTAHKLDILAAGKAPTLRKGSFNGVKDELLAMLEGCAE